MLDFDSSYVEQQLSRTCMTLFGSGECLKWGLVPPVGGMLQMVLKLSDCLSRLWSVGVQSH